MILKWDGHTHTKFCYHGSDYELEQYIERSIELGFQRYTVSEHSPLPDRWVPDERLMQELAMPLEELADYFTYVQQIQQKFADRMDVTVGLEIDYLHGNTTFTEQMLDRWHTVLDDVVFSVHYLPGVGGMRCIDFTADDFRQHLLAHYGSMQTLVDVYYDHVEQAIDFAAKLPMRKRIGHVQLIEKFHTVLPEIDPAQIERRLRGLIPRLTAGGVGIDVNTAGIRVATCGKPYVPEWFLRECIQQGIECVYGSDAHKPEQVGLGWDWYESCRTDSASE